MKVEISLPNAELSEILRLVIKEELSFILPSHSIAFQGKELLSLEECSELTGFAKSTIYHMVSSNSIPYSKKNGRLFFFRSTILDWIREGDQSTSSKALNIAEDRLLNSKKKRA